jgi:hypothetical protein
MICLIVKVLLSLRSVLALSERLHRVVSILVRPNVQWATLEDRGSGVCQSVNIKTLRWHQLSVFGVESRGLPDPSRRLL